MVLHRRKFFETHLEAKTCKFFLSRSSETRSVRTASPVKVEQTRRTRGVVFPVVSSIMDEEAPLEVGMRHVIFRAEVEEAQSAGTLMRV